MERRIESDVEGWPTRPFEDGFEGLRQLAAADFSGVVRAGGAWLFFVNGKIVGVFEGSLEDVDGTQGTAHKAPHPSLPLLYAMQTKGGDTRAKYYTNETPISEVDQTLSSGGFTGYVELSENVLSGDYYQLYHAGSSMSVAFVGNSGRMITGDEAFERADDEVGIYEVVDVDVQVTEVPGPDGADSDDAGSADADTDDAGSEDAGGGTSESGDDEADDPTSDPEPAERAQDAETSAAAATEDDDGDEAGDDAPIEAGPAPDAATDDASSEEAEAAGSDDGQTVSRNRDASEATTSAGSSAQSAGASQTASTREPETSSASDAGAGSSDATAGASRERSTSRSSGRSESGSTARQEDPQRSEAAWREATTVPSLDPDNSDDGPSGAQSRSESGTQRRSRSAQESRQQASARSGSQSAERSRSSGGQSAGDPGVNDTFEEEVLEREDRLDRLQQRVENLQDEREEIAEERDELAERVESLSEENESLRSEVRELEAELEELEASAGVGGATGGADAAGGGPMSPRAALEGTDLFVRYDSKGQPTLEAAHDGSADAAAVNENLRLDVHTQFEDAGVTVDGEPFEAFLEETMAFRFVEWLVRKLPYEIRETGSESALRDLYDAIPEIDRVEFHGEVARDAMEDEEGAPSETFDVVVRDKMGEALLVANMNDARDPATGRMIVDLQEAASRVKEHSMALSGAFFVTRSFFEPEALETTSEATSGSLLSRDSRASYVKLSRKQGYHLCLVEARGEDLHLNVPEL